MQLLFTYLNVSPRWLILNLLLTVAASVTIGYADPPGKLLLLMLSLFPTLQVQNANEHGEFPQRLARVLLAGLLNILVIIAAYSLGKWLSARP